MLSGRRFSPGRKTLRSIFINYRRNDSEGEAGRLFDELTAQFSENSVFMDVAAIEPGKDFRKAIDESVASCTVLLAMIGQEWLATRDATGNRRLEDTHDFVRLELASALRRDIPVVPVLVRGAKMPLAEHLPDDLKDLAYRNAVELTHARWKSDVQVLVRALRPLLEGPSARADGAAQPEPVGEPPQRVPAPTAATLAPEVLALVSRALAVSIGPIADVVVRRRAQRAKTAAELCEIVSREIPADADRAKFLKACRSAGLD
ncbi:MAG TPA: toll/interleukin-1 receptor domain-containing protein [Acidobacteriaceae bacterium]|nr:toll/interleukin-1 receptor domain-containing protein [Acidobacteriaceae bacterium]